MGKVTNNSVHRRALTWVKLQQCAQEGTNMGKVTTISQVGTNMGKVMCAGMGKI